MGYLIPSEELRTALFFAYYEAMTLGRLINISRDNCLANEASARVGSIYWK